jgi:hypothetical protein
MPDVSVTKKQKAGNGGLTRLLGWEPMFEGSMFQPKSGSWVEG